MRQLKRRELRELESILGVFFSRLSSTIDDPTERFMVFDNDEDERYLGDVTANGTFFEYEELKVRTIEMIGNKGIEKEYPG